MIKCTVRDREELLAYIGKDYDKCAYLYIDFRKYGLENENVEMWKQLDESGEICVIALRYYNGMHLFSRGNVFDAEDVKELIRTVRPALVCGMKDTLSRFEGQIPGYIHEYGKVLKLGAYSGIAGSEVRRATREELKDIVELLMTDEEMGGPYTFDLLYKQFCERFDEGFGRNWVRMDDKGVVSHCATYAEMDDLAVISGGIVRMDYRGTGQYPGQLGAMCKDLYEEGKCVISFYYGGAKSAHKAVGFDILGDWEKLILCEDKTNE